MGSLTPNKGYSLPTVGGDTGVWGNENNASFSVLDNNMGGVAAVPVGGNTNVTATAAQAQNLVQNLTGVLTGNIAYILPSLGSFYVIANNTTGAFNITIKTGLSGSTVIAPQGQDIWVYCDGTNFFTSDHAPAPGLSSVSVAGSSNVTAAPTQLGFQGIALTGALTASILYILPPYPGMWVIVNQTTGNFNLVISAVGGGQSVAIPQGQSMQVFSDGTNAFSATTEPLFAPVNVNVAGSSNVTLTITQGATGHINFTGLLTGNINVTFPITGFYTVADSTTGAFTITMQGLTSTTTMLTERGYNILMYNDGSNITTSNWFNNGVGLLQDNSGFNLRAISPNGLFGAGFKNDGGSAYFVSTNSGNAQGAPNAYRPFVWNLSTGSVNIDESGAGSTFGGGMAVVNGNPVGAQTPGFAANSNGVIQMFTNGSISNITTGGGTSGNIAQFYSASLTLMGSITSNLVNAVAYNTTSDARLKIPMSFISGIGRMIDRLKPRWFMWKECPDQPPEPGFFAQEVYKIWPWAVKKGKGKPGQAGFMPWQMDNAKLIPLLVAEIQELRQRVATLEKEVSRGRHVR